MTTTPATIHDVWIYTKQRRRKPDVFDLSLSAAGIVVLRPERAARHLGWDRISDCEIEKRQGYLLLILRGGGSTTRLVVTGWSFEDLDALLREARRGSTAPESDNGSARPTATPAMTAEPDGGDARATKTADPAKATKAARATNAARATKAADTPTTARTAEATGAAGVAAVAKAHRSAGATKAAGAAEKAKAAEPAAATAKAKVAAPAAAAAKAKAAAPAAAAEVAPPEPAWADTELADALAPEPTVWQQVPWKPVVTVVLLGLLVFAVIVVLLQSAGLIDWGFLGPTA